MVEREGEKRGRGERKGREEVRNEERGRGGGGERRKEGGGEERRKGGGRGPFALTHLHLLLTGRSAAEKTKNLLTSNPRERERLQTRCEGDLLLTLLKVN